MKQITPLHHLNNALNGHEAEIMLLRALVNVLLDANPQRQKILERFQSEVAGLLKNAPTETDQELLIEIQARLQTYLAALNLPHAPI